MWRGQSPSDSRLQPLSAQLGIGNRRAGALQLLGQFRPDRLIPGVRDEDVWNARPKDGPGRSRTAVMNDAGRAREEPGIWYITDQMDIRWRLFPPHTAPPAMQDRAATYPAHHVQNEIGHGSRVFVRHTAEGEDHGRLSRLQELDQFRVGLPLLVVQEEETGDMIVR